MTALDFLIYRTLRLTVHLLGGLPDSIREYGSSLLGRILFALDRKHRRIALSNLRYAFENEKSMAEIYSIARSVFRNLGRMLFEIAWAERLPENRFADHFFISGLENYDRAVSRGRGVLLLTAHFGNWELLPIAAHMARMPMRIVYRPLDSLLLERIVKQHRCRFGAQVIPTRRGAMQKIFRALREGYPVAMLMDQNVDWYSGVFVDFFNHRACTNKGLALLALKSRAPVLPVFLIRSRNGFHAVVGPELPLIRTGDRVKDIECNTQQYNRVIETCVRSFPDQWFWVHQRWKTRPYKPWPRDSAIQ